MFFWIRRQSAPFLILTIIMLHYAITWLVMYSLEHDSELMNNFLYWYLISISTTGYGDLLPQTYWGRIFVAVWVAILGIAIMAIIFGAISSFLMRFHNDFKKGKLKMNLKDHLIIVCNNEKKTQSIIANLKADSSTPKILLFSDQIAANTDTEISFVNGSLEIEEDCERACFNTASKIMIVPENDTEALGQTFLCLNHTTNAQIVVHVKDSKTGVIVNEQTCERVNVVSSIDDNVLVQETLDPGSFIFLKMITDNTNGININTFTNEEEAIGIDIRSRYSDGTLIIGFVNGLGEPQILSDSDFIESGVKLISLGQRNPKRR